MFVAALGYMSLVVTYSLLAACTVEILLALWQVKDPPLDIAFRLVVLAVPPVAPLLFALSGWLAQPVGLRQDVALLDLRNWLGQNPDLGHPVYLLLMGVMAVTAWLEGLALLRWILAARARRPDSMSASEGRLSRLAGEMRLRGVRLPAVRVVAHLGPVAYTVGLIRPTILVSPSLVELLDDEELEAVLAHEAVHAERQDNWLGWLTFALRVASFYNPVAHFIYHRMGHDLEVVCDAGAAKSTGKGLALASALIKVYMATRRPAPEPGGLANVVESRTVALENRARRRLVQDRAELLVHPAVGRPTSYPQLRIVLAALAVLGLMYVVV